MAEQHGAAAVDHGDIDYMDMPAHEETYAQFLALTQVVISSVLSILLLLVLWGLKGHGILALIGFILTCLAAALGGLTGLGWKMIAPVFILIGLACIVT